MSGFIKILRQYKIPETTQLTQHIHFIFSEDTLDDEKLFFLQDVIRQTTAIDQSHRISIAILDGWKQLGESFFNSFEESDEEDIPEFILSSLRTLDFSDDEEEEEEDMLEDLDTTSMTPLQLLESLFPNNDPDLLIDLLVKTNYDIEAVINKLSDTSNKTDQVQLQPKQICRHFLAGACYRHNCWFAHDTNQSVICKFWAQGYCMKEDRCEFVHGSDIKQIVSEYKDKLKPQTSSNSLIPPTLQSDEFPSLVSQPQTQPTHFSRNFSNVLKSQPKLIQKTPIENMNSYNSSLTLQKVKMNGLSWVNTGDDLNSHYIQQRQEAGQLAIERNKLFQKATLAYQTGNKASARNLSMQAHKMNEMIESLNQKAANQIYTTRNTKRKKDQNGYTIIDLHGLHPNEAISILEDELRGLESIHYKGNPICLFDIKVELTFIHSSQGDVVIVTGTGHHSRGRKAKVLPKVLEHLKHSGRRVKQGTMEDGRGGILYLKV